MKIIPGLGGTTDLYFSSWPQFLIEVQKGNVPGHTLIRKFAENQAIQAATEADIWDYGFVEELYTYSITDDIDTVSSDNINDTVEITVQGLDINYEEVSQQVTLNGQNKITLGTSLIRVFRAYNNNSTPLVGNVYIYTDTAIALGVPIDTTKVKAYIRADEEQTLMSHYTIPAGKTGYFLGLSASISRVPAATNCTFTGKVRLFNKVFRTQIRFNLSTTGSSYMYQPAASFYEFPEKTDFLSRGIVNTNNTGVTAEYEILLIDNK